MLLLIVFLIGLVHFAWVGSMSDALLKNCLLLLAHDLHKLRRLQCGSVEPLIQSIELSKEGVACEFKPRERHPESSPDNVVDVPLAC